VVRCEWDHTCIADGLVRISCGFLVRGHSWYVSTSSHRHYRSGVCKNASTNTSGVSRSFEKSSKLELYTHIVALGASGNESFGYFSRDVPATTHSLDGTLVEC
jgi:hypothetical protein